MDTVNRNTIIETDSKPESVSKGVRLAYALPAFALAVVGIPIYVYIPKFYSDVVGVHVGLLGIIILAIRVFDALSDPVIGYVSDKTQTRFGRRRPYIGLGALLLGFSIYFLFNPLEASQNFETVWFAVWLFLVFLFWTLVTVPYEALGPELTSSYQERISLFGIRDGALIAGTLVAAASPAMITAALELGPTATDQRLKFTGISMLYIPMVVLFSWWCIWKIREKPSVKIDSHQHRRKGIQQITANKPFMILLIAYSIASFGSNLPATLILYYVEYVLQSQRADVFLLLYFGIGIFLLPVWLVIARKIGKKSTWLAAMLINTGAFIGVFFLDAGDEWLYGILVALSGIGFGASIAIPSAMQADVIDYGELLSGKRLEGQYIGIWSVSKKLAAAAGVGIALSLLGISGYEPNVDQSEQIQSTLRVLYALVPSLCNGVALLIALAYPINSKNHQQILDAITNQKNGKEVIDPLTGNPLK